ncbi:MBOAT family O-acyltransferase [Candidatus Magnetominusculus dajiuhuensis]|uniref:MBOAT family O-acyltransferase n=1 Tax=Candidatus Magnetominusculus dajiuhuensis TaxID=3137712 RepID=UPI003B4297B4
MDIALLSLILPLGISFFTLTQITFLVDCYEGSVKTSFVNYFLFVTFFPHLIMGPIIHHKDMMPQFDSLRAKIFNKQNLVKGLLLFSIGLLKKVGIADMFSSWANYGFDTTTILTLTLAWKTSLSYSLQLYFDFSGYTDMALGTSLMFNIHMPLNFDSPYKALNIQDFWRRWHMTLSRFLRDYVYIPLGGNRICRLRTDINVFAVFIIGGLWHGAGWGFLVWGALHGLAYATYSHLKKFTIKMPAVVAWCIMFNFINITWIFFRAKSFESALKVLRGMSGFAGLGLEFLRADILQYGAIIIFLFVCFFGKNSMELSNIKTPSFKTVLISICLLITSVIIMIEKNMASEFLYFNF